ncbi:hypothetical protein ABE10_10610, partial [Bacillus toyonensis]|nr:hypothetical protein [Bacillus toyonensis]
GHPTRVGDDLRPASMSKRDTTLTADGTIAAGTGWWRSGRGHGRDPREGPEGYQLLRTSGVISASLLGSAAPLAFR